MTAGLKNIHAIEIARSFAILAVIAIHSGSLFLADHADAVLGRALFAARFAVPLFIMISGYLHKKREDSVPRPTYFKSYLIKRFKRIIVPYLLFSALYMAIRVVIEQSQFLQSFVEIKYDSLESIAAAIFLVKENPAGHLYFLPLLFFVIVLFCLASECFRNRHVLLMACVSASLLAYAVGGNIYLSLNPVKGIGFYALGYYTRLQLHERSAHRTTFGLFIASLLAYLLVWRFADGWGGQWPLYRLPALFCYHAASALVVLQLSFYCLDIGPLHLLTGGLKFIGKYSYPVFLWHEPYIVSVLYRILIKLSVNQMFLNQMVLMLAGLFLPILWYRYGIVPAKRWGANLSMYKTANQ